MCGLVNIKDSPCRIGEVIGHQAEAVHIFAHCFHILFTDHALELPAQIEGWNQLQSIIYLNIYS